MLPMTTHVLGPLETDIMQIVWSAAGPLTVKQIHRVLSEGRTLAYTTVMTTCVRLAEKRILHREQIAEWFNAAYVYTALLRHQDLLLARVEQVLASADEVERQYVAAAIRGVGVRR